MPPSPSQCGCHIWLVPKGAAQVAGGGACPGGSEGAVAAHGAEAHPAAEAALPPRQGGSLFGGLTEWRRLTEERERVRAINTEELF